MSKNPYGGGCPECGGKRYIRHPRCWVGWLECSTCNVETFPIETSRLMELQDAEALWREVWPKVVALSPERADTLAAARIIALLDELDSRRKDAQARGPETSQPQEPAE